MKHCVDIIAVLTIVVLSTHLGVCSCHMKHCVDIIAVLTRVGVLQENLLSNGVHGRRAIINMIAIQEIIVAVIHVQIKVGNSFLSFNRNHGHSVRHQRITAVTEHIPVGSTSMTVLLQTVAIVGTKGME